MKIYEHDVKNFREADEINRELDNLELYNISDSSYNEELKKGFVRINCGSKILFADHSGRLWLPDHIMTHENEETMYGVSGARFVKRESIEIENTENPELYRTELCGEKKSYTNFPSLKANTIFTSTSPKHFTKIQARTCASFL